MLDCDHYPNTYLSSRLSVSCTSLISSEYTLWNWVSLAELNMKSLLVFPGALLKGIQSPENNNLSF